MRRLTMEGGFFREVVDAQGLACDAAAEDYERGRTGWPPEALTGVDGAAALDLAAGPGKLTRLLVERFARVFAVEPAQAMRRLGARLVPEATWLEGTAEQLPLADRSVDAALVAEAIHWFDGWRAARELARVLRQDRLLVFLFNAWEWPSDPPLPPAALRAVEEAVSRTGPPGRAKVETGEWRAAFRDVPFAPFQYREVPHTHTTDREGVIAYYLSISSIAARPAAEREELRDLLRRLIPETSYTLRLHTEVWSTRRL